MWVTVEIIISFPAEHISWCPHGLIIGSQKQVRNFHPCERPGCCTKEIAFQIHRETDAELKIIKVGNKRTINK